MQIYANVCERPLLLARSGEACALGAAVFGAVVGGAHASTQAAQAAMTGTKELVYRPEPAQVTVYRELYALYRQVHDAFGTSGARDISNVMKDLLRLRDRVRSSPDAK
jgi:L-ribulokinase